MIRFWFFVASTLLLAGPALTSAEATAQAATLPRDPAISNETAPRTPAPPRSHSSLGETRSLSVALGRTPSLPLRSHRNPQASERPAADDSAAHDADSRRTLRGDVNNAPMGHVEIVGTDGYPTTMTADIDSIDDLDGMTSSEFSFQWIGVLDGIASDIDSATDQSYIADLTDGYDGYRVRVSYTDDGGAEEMLTSETTLIRPHVVRYAQRLPDLVSTAPRMVVRGLHGVGEVIVLPADGTDRLQYNDVPMQLLWFYSDIDNIGAGPVHATGDPQLSDPLDDTSHDVWQFTLDADDAWIKLHRPPIRFERADGHNHFHWMRIAEFSLWNEAGTVLVKRSPKIGFCLADVVKIDPGDATVPDRVYTGAGCHRNEPDATEITIGLSPQYRDIYNAARLSFQWVDISDVAPGRYRLGGQSDPYDTVWESDETNNGVVLTESTHVVPGYVATPTVAATQVSTSVSVALQSDSYGTPGAPKYRIVEVPQSGTLDQQIQADLDVTDVIYTPDCGFIGTDSFTYEAFDSESSFPRNPVRATAIITVDDVPPVITGLSSLDFPENAQQIVAEFDAGSATDCELAAWSLGGVDGAAFEIDNGALRFASELGPPDFEARLSNTYQLTIQFTDGVDSAGAPDASIDDSHDLTVTVTNVEETGVIALSSSAPQLNSAIDAELRDPDGGINSVAWSWLRSPAPSSPGSWAVIDGASTASYTPVEQDAGFWLRAEASYSDARGPNKSAQATTLSAVPRPPVRHQSRPVLTPAPRRTSAGGSGSAAFNTGTTTFVVANGWNAADIGIAVVVAARSDDAIVLYTSAETLPEETASLMRDASPAQIVIVGGTTAVSRGTRTQMRAASPDSRVTRITGDNRVATAVSAARRILGGPADAGRVTWIVANGWSPPDIGAAAALAARSERSAVLYTPANSLAEEAAAALREYDSGRVILIGGTSAIDPAVERAIADAAVDASVTRLTGADRAETAAAAARQVLGDPPVTEETSLVIANGRSLPDIGVAAALAASLDGSAVIYTSHDVLSAASAALIADYRPSRLFIVGGTSAVAEETEAEARALAPGTRLARYRGASRIETASVAARRILARR
ncbi:cell wall-binding repeat-containing protein [Candidatus Poriferisodalis sp.]|uniref:cell wall-binding repeat-containing protein n=1 Tax=Candidatus Poriferisodalis sp. TaxID=3101277 RepID=UPI003B028D57